MWVWQSLRKQETKQDDETGKKRGTRSAVACGAPQSGEGTMGRLLFAGRADLGERVHWPLLREELG